MTDMPSTIRVGPYIHAVDQVDITGSGADGLHDLSLQRIVVNPGMPAMYTRGVLLHEVIHACLSVGATFLDHDQQEQVCAQLEATLLGVLRDNPELVKYLTEEV